MRRLRALSETECYIRCYGGWEQTVRLVALDDAGSRPPFGSVLAGEAVRRLFEEKLAPREPEVAPEAA